MIRISRRTAAGVSGTLALLVVMLAALLAAGAGGALAQEESVSFRLIVHSNNSVDVVDRDFASAAFLKKTLRWPHDEVIRAVDLRPDAPTRERFSQEILRRSVPAVKSYWQQRIFTGRGVPPPELDSEAAVVRYVQRHRGAVGYVSDRTDTSDVKVLSVR
jgi:hypothetical protein